ncbi:MAG TPA: ATP-binding cassette domain-containing protein [Actinocrinis sp.]|jgi:branched-chain amino acid transport system ATP-binding protein
MSAVTSAVRVKPNEWRVAGLSISGLRVGYGSLEALHGVDLTIPRTGVTLLLGRNGAGKTTLLNTIAGLRGPTEGALDTFAATPPGDASGNEDRISLLTLSTAERTRRGITLIPDRAGVFGRLTVAENLDLFARFAAGPQAALELFPELREHLGRRAGTLSGGQQQMLALARAVLAPWRLLLVDELGHGLAAGVAERCYAAFAAMAANADGGREQGAAEPRSIVLAEPHSGAAWEAADHVAVLRRGEVSFAGPRDSVGPAALNTAMD